MSASLLLLVLVLNFPMDVLVLRSGDRIEVDGKIQETEGRVVFRTIGGALYSLPLTEIDIEATRAAATAPVLVRAFEGRTKLNVSREERKRLLKVLESNHAGKPPVEQRILEAPPAPPRREDVQATVDEELAWRNRARAHEEAVRQAREDLQLLHDQAERFRGEIGSFLSLGYRPHQFTYQTTQLQYVLERIPAAELNVRRAERAYAQFRDDARRQGILPGWLR